MTNDESTIELCEEDAVDPGAGDGTPDGAVLGIAFAKDDVAREDDGTPDGLLLGQMTNDESTIELSEEDAVCSWCRRWYT